MGSSNSRPGVGNKPAPSQAAVVAPEATMPAPAVDESPSPFVVSVQLPHKRVFLALPHQARPTITCLHDEVARQEGVARGLLTVHARGKEVYWGDEALELGVDYSVVAFPVFRELAWFAAADDDDADADGRIVVKALPKLLAKLCQKTRPGVHLWRASSPRSEHKWVELVVEGPTSSYYDGGTFVLRVEDKESEMMGCTYHYLTVRLMTPLYHPTVGPDGQIVLWHHYEWDQRHEPWEIVSAFVRQLKLDVPPILHHSMQTQLPPVKGMLEEWKELGADGAAAKARLWTWHYATAHGRAYRRSGGRCVGLAMLASLIKADPQAQLSALSSSSFSVRSEVRQVLLVANRLHRHGGGDEAEDDVNASRPAALASLPTELLHSVLMVVASGRLPPEPPSPDWKLAREDDGLPLDWSARRPS